MAEADEVPDGDGRARDVVVADGVHARARHVPTRDDDGRHLVRERAQRAGRQPVRDQDQALDLELEQLVELHLLQRGIGAPGHEHRAVAVGAHLGLHPVEDLREDGIVQVEDQDADGAAASVGEAAGCGVGAVPELRGGREDGVPAGLADLGGAAQGQGDERLGDAGPRGDVMDGGTGLAHGSVPFRVHIGHEHRSAACDRLLAGDGDAQALERRVGRARVPGLAEGQGDERTCLLAEGVPESIDEPRVRGVPRSRSPSSAWSGVRLFSPADTESREPCTSSRTSCPSASCRVPVMRTWIPFVGDGQDRADVGIAELGVLVLGPHRLGGVDRLHLGAGQPADEVEVVHVHVPEDAATAGDELARRGRVVVRGHRHRVEDADAAVADPVVDARGSPGRSGAGTRSAVGCRGARRGRSRAGSPTRVSAIGFSHSTGRPCCSTASSREPWASVPTATTVASASEEVAHPPTGRARHRSGRRARRRATRCGWRPAPRRRGGRRRGPPPGWRPSGRRRERGSA